jgi:hypothetical protein
VLSTVIEPNKLFQGSAGVLGWSSTTGAASTADTAFSRISAGVIGVGTGAQGSTAGQLDLTTILFTASASAPTSAGTAGTAGQIIYNGALLYLCTVTGAAGSATWNKFTLSAV